MLHLLLGLYHPAEWPCLYILLVFMQGFFLLNVAGRSRWLDTLLGRKPVGAFAGEEIIVRFIARLLGAGGAVAEAQGSKGARLHHTRRVRRNNGR
jgi:hypothetical protein